MKNINNFTQWKNESVDVTFTNAITHQKHLAQFRRSTRSAVDIFNSLHIFGKELIRKQEIKVGVNPATISKPEFCLFFTILNMKMYPIITYINIHGWQTFPVQFCKLKWPFLSFLVHKRHVVRWREI